MATYVIVHGAWGGGWAWRRVGLHLRQAGHEIFTPTMTGLGERSHLLTSAVNLETHVQDIANVLVYEDLREVILVGHSYGGMVITSVADRLAERIKHLVYLDAFIPSDGQSLYDILLPEQVTEFEAQANATGNGWRIPPMGLPPDTPEEDRAWINARRGPHPRQAFTQPARLPTGVAESLPRTYVHCTLKPGRDMFAQFAEQTRQDLRWRFHALDCGHNLQYAAPRETADILLSLI